MGTGDLLNRSNTLVAVFSSNLGGSHHRRQSHHRRHLRPSSAGAHSQHASVMQAVRRGVAAVNRSMRGFCTNAGPSASAGNEAVKATTRARMTGVRRCCVSRWRYAMKLCEPHGDLDAAAACIVGKSWFGRCCGSWCSRILQPSTRRATKEGYVA